MGGRDRETRGLERAARGRAEAGPGARDQRAAHAVSADMPITQTESQPSAKVSVRSTGIPAM